MIDKRKTKAESINKQNQNARVMSYAELQNDDKME